jgi:hypothetical protein
LGTSARASVTGIVAGQQGAVASDAVGQPVVLVEHPSEQLVGVDEQHVALEAARHRIDHDESILV